MNKQTIIENILLLHFTDRVTCIIIEYLFGQYENEVEKILLQYFDKNLVKIIMTYILYNYIDNTTLLNNFYNKNPTKLISKIYKHLKVVYKINYIGMHEEDNEGSDYKYEIVYVFVVTGRRIRRKHTNIYSIIIG